MSKLDEQDAEQKITYPLDKIQQYVLTRVIILKNRICLISFGGEYLDLLQNGINTTSSLDRHL